METTMSPKSFYIKGLGEVTLEIKKDYSTPNTPCSLIMTQGAEQPESIAKWYFDEENKSKNKKRNFYKIDNLFDKMLSELVKQVDAVIDYTETESNTLLGTPISIQRTTMQSKNNLNSSYEYTRVYSKEDGLLLLTIERTNKSEHNKILNITSTKDAPYTFIHDEKSKREKENFIKKLTGSTKCYIDSESQTLSQEEIELILKEKV